VSSLNDQRNNKQNKQLPITGTEDVEFSRESADEEDLEALKRAEAADHRNMKEQ